MRNASRYACLVATLAVAVGLVACGGSDDSSGAGDAGERVSGQLRPIAGSPAGSGEVGGEVTLDRAGGRTVVSLRATGLEPHTDYVAHLHLGGCDQSDPGGPHFKFDPDGSEQPPNEIHLEFRSNGAGSGSASATSDREVPAGDAGSVVLHGDETDDMASEKVACAELEGGKAAAADGHEEHGTAAVETIVIRDGEPVGGVRELEYSAGDEIEFQVESDVADEVHVHGYDVSEDVPAGGTASLSFPADIEGIFEVELEQRAVQIAEIRVNP